MGQSLFRHLQKSTNVRIDSLGEQTLHLALRTLSTLSPDAAGTLAARLFFTPKVPDRRHFPEVWGLEPRTFQVASRGVRLAARSWGSGPAVLLVHGWAGRSDQLHRFVTPLVDCGFRAVVFDMPAHGDSTGRQSSVVEMARAIRAVQEVVGPLHAVIAHSLGATATALALLEGLAAERVVLIAPAADPGAYARRSVAGLGLDAAGTRGLLERFEAHVGLPMDALDLRNRVGRLRVPVLFLHDTADREVPFKDGADLAAAWPGAELEPLQGLGHRRMLRDLRTIDRAVGFVSAPLERRSPRASATAGSTAPTWDWFVDTV